jgi:hypothetical protein
MEASHTFVSGVESSNNQVEHRFANVIFERLEGSAGKRYITVVKDCLRAMAAGSEEQDQENERILGIEAQSLRTLRQIAENI